MRAITLAGSVILRQPVNAQATAAKFNPTINTTANSTWPALKQAKAANNQASPQRTRDFDRKSS